MEILRLSPYDADRVVRASELFDGPVRREWAERFLASDHHHLLFAEVAGRAVGFVSAVEMTHPDKGTEMFLYELSVAEDFRRRGIGRALTERLSQLAAERGCYGMWVATEPDNDAAVATYAASGAQPPERTVVLAWSLTG